MKLNYLKKIKSTLYRGGAAVLYWYMYDLVNEL
jgi:hypothetical protein